MAGRAESAPCALAHCFRDLTACPQRCKAGLVIIATFQMRKLRFREARLLDSASLPSTSLQGGQNSVVSYS